MPNPPPNASKHHPATLAALIEKFSADPAFYRSDRYNEENTRHDFINPFFSSLGWDIGNSANYADAYRDVVLESPLKTRSSSTAPDYCFRAGGTPKFFVEAKKPGVNLNTDPKPAFQLRRYGWSARLPLSVLTDFEEFAIYDTRVRPKETDKPSTARIFYCSYADYPARWDQIASILSRDAVYKGSFDRYAADNRVKKGTTPVDDAFLEEIESWRDALARNLALRNSLSQPDLNFAVQRIIDRLIFLRIAEDRGIEGASQLQKLAEGASVYSRLNQLFLDADKKYNSGLFHFRPEKDRHESPDSLTPSLAIDDKVLREIISSLYYPAPYDFRAFPPDVLGQVYEQFLGKVITLSDSGHRAKVEEKPEVRKAGGVYYTPTYIVDYIVKNTVGKLLEGKTPADAAKLKILDPACGSGSFLLGAYQFLLDWHLDYYVNHNPEKHARGKNPPIFRVTSPDPSPSHLPQSTTRHAYRLTPARRKEILTNSIFGVDIDPQAVEVTKLSLLLKVLEGESAQSIGAQLDLYRQRALPDLGDNIKCGNSLIGYDFYDNHQMSLLPDEDKKRINVFDWQKEFPSIMKEGGFHAVIGNPPYVRQESIKPLKEYFKSHYKSFESTADLYTYFIEKAIRLLRPDGLHSFIVSSSFLRSNFGKPLRSFLAEHAALLQITDFGGLPVFEDAKDTYVCIPLFARRSGVGTVSVINVHNLGPAALDESSASPFSLRTHWLCDEAWSLDREEVQILFRKIAEGKTPLGKYASSRIYLGVKTGLNEAFEIDAQTRNTFLKKCPPAEAIIRRFLGGQDIRRYYTKSVSQFLIAIPCGWTIANMPVRGTKPSEREAWKWMANEFPPIANHLVQFADAARARQDQGDFWWELRPCDYYSVLNGSKLIYPDIAKGPRFFLDTDSNYIRNTAYCIDTKDRYLLGLLNSKLMWFAVARISIPFGTRAGEYRYRMFTQYIEQLPIRPIDFSNKSDKSKHDHLVSLVDQMLSLHAKLPTTQSPHDRDSIQRQIDATDRQIDRLVYDLYSLSDPEIQTIESATSPT